MLSDTFHVCLIRHALRAAIPQQAEFQRRMGSTFLYDLFTTKIVRVFVSAITAFASIYRLLWLTFGVMKV